MTFERSVAPPLLPYQPLTPLCLPQSRLARSPIAVVHRDHAPRSSPPHRARPLLLTPLIGRTTSSSSQSSTLSSSPPPCPRATRVSRAQRATAGSLRAPSRRPSSPSETCGEEGRVHSFSRRFCCKEFQLLSCTLRAWVAGDSGVGARGWWTDEVLRGRARGRSDGLRGISSTPVAEIRSLRGGLEGRRSHPQHQHRRHQKVLEPGGQIGRASCRERVS